VLYACRSKLFHRTHLYDVLRGLIYICSLIALNHFGQMSRAYHYIRGEAMIKLYVIFNILEVGVAAMCVVCLCVWCHSRACAAQILSKLCASVGQDAFDSLYRTTRDTPRSYGSLAGHFVVTLVYVVVHSLFLFVQIVSLNVAINSHSNALLTLLVSNNFIELKVLGVVCGFASALRDGTLGVRREVFSRSLGRRTSCKSRAAVGCGLLVVVVAVVVVVVVCVWHAVARTSLLSVWPQMPSNGSSWWCT